jgi:putative DNA primase/helicase
VPNLTVEDLARHQALGIPPSLLEQAGVERVTDAQARALLTSRHPGDLAGVAYPYSDPATGRPLTCRVRRDHPEMEDGKPRDKYLAAFGDSKHLFFPPGAGELLADTSVPVCLVEAEKSVLAITAAACRTGRQVLVIGTGGCWGWRGRIGKSTDATGTRVDEKGPLPDLARVTWTDRIVAILFDANAATNAKVQAARRGLAQDLADRGARVQLAELPVEPHVNGPDDYVGTHGDAALFGLIDKANVLQRTSKRDPKPKQGRAVQFEDPDPWPVPVDGGALLDAIAATFDRYLTLPQHASATLALWVVHAYAFHASFTSPLLAITSPVKQCGKTLLLIVLGALVPRRLLASNVTPAALFRTIEKFSPTFLIDEADTFIRDKDELRGVLNSGHTRTTAVVIRAVGEEHDPRVFSTWCPKAIALIGRLPDTLADRAIEIAMRRRTAGEHIERLRQDRIDSECSTIRRQAARWTADHLAELEGADPHVPPELRDRAADCWRSLLAVADCAGTDWPVRARKAAKLISAVEDDADQPAAILLLDDVCAVFGPKDELASADLAQRLLALDSRPWRTWGKDGKGLTTHALARLLRDFKIRPVKIRFGDDTLSGYTRRMFEEAWASYTPLRLEQRNKPNSDGPESRISEPERPDGCSSSENAVSTNNNGHCSGVPLQRGEKGGDGWLEL